MALAQSLTAIIIFWAIIGGLGASLLLPAMQSLIHGNFEGAAQKKAYALVGAAAAIAAAVGPLLGGFITTYLSWRVAFLLEVVVIAIVLSGIKLVRDVPYTGPRQRRRRRRGPLRPRHGRHRARHPGVAGGRRVRRRAPRGRRGRAGGARLLAACAASVRASRRCSTRTCSASKLFRLGITQQMLQQIALGGTMIALPIYLQMVLEYNAMQAGLSLAPLSLSMFGVGARSPGRRPATGARAASSGWGSRSSRSGLVLLIPIVPRADSGWYLVVPLMIAGCRARACWSRSSTTTRWRRSPRSGSARPPA